MLCVPLLQCRAFWLLSCEYIVLCLSCCFSTHLEAASSSRWQILGALPVLSSGLSTERKKDAAGLAAATIIKSRLPFLPLSSLSLSTLGIPSALKCGAAVGE